MGPLEMKGGHVFGMDERDAAGGGGTSCREAMVRGDRKTTLLQREIRCSRTEGGDGGPRVSGNAKSEEDRGSKELTDAFNVGGEERVVLERKALGE